MGHPNLQQSLKVVVKYLTMGVLVLLAPSAGRAQTGSVEQFYDSYNEAVAIETPRFFEIGPQLTIQYDSSARNGLAARAWFHAWDTCL